MRLGCRPSELPQRYTHGSDSRPAEWRDGVSGKQKKEEEKRRKKKKKEERSTKIDKDQRTSAIIPNAHMGMSHEITQHHVMNMERNVKHGHSMTASQHEIYCNQSVPGALAERDPRVGIWNSSRRWAILSSASIMRAKAADASGTARRAAFCWRRARGAKNKPI